MSFIKEFKEFAMRGNVVDLAVGVVIGGAFGKIVESLVKDMVMPVVGIITGSGFEGLFIPLTGGEFKDLAEAEAAKAAILKYGSFIQATVNFFIIAFAVFMMVKLMNSLKRKEETAPAAPPPTPEDIALLREIRDALKRS